MKRFMKFGKGGALLSALLLCLPSAPVVRADAPSSTTAPSQQTGREPARLSMDVVTNAARELRGSVVNSKSAPVANARVVLSMAGGKNPVEATTDATGAFLFKDVRPGVYSLNIDGSEGQTQRVARVWTEDTAPPAATPVALVSLQETQPNNVPGNEDVVRGLDAGGGGLLIAGLIAAGIAAAIALPIVLSHSTSSSLSSP